MRLHGIAVSVSACGPEGLGSNPGLAKVRNDAIFFLGVLITQFNLTKFIGEPVLMKI